MYSNEFADLIEHIKKDPSIDYDAEITALGRADEMLDRKWAIALREGDPALRSRIRCKTKSTVNGRPSGAQMFLNLCRVVDATSPKLVHKLQSAFSNWKPVEDAAELLVE
jgi:hypothetical protein